MLAFYLYFMPQDPDISQVGELGGLISEGIAMSIQSEGWDNRDRRMRENYLGLARQRPAAELRKSCMDIDDVAEICTALAYETQDLDVLGRACTLGDVEACGPWGYFAFDGAAPEDRAAIQERVLDGCRRGGGAACAAYARNTRIDPAHGDVATAVGWAHIACIANYDGWACAEASWLREANGFPEERRIPGCQNSDAVACDADPVSPAGVDAMEYHFGWTKREPKAPEPG